MNKLQNLEKALNTHLKESKDLVKFRMIIQNSLAARQYSWFELFYEEDKGDRSFMDLVRSFLYKDNGFLKDFNEFPVGVVPENQN